ncbi:MAG: outer membrane protein transport protein [bacterium]|nr:outer membrane protein transport protein [bacterium]
MKRFVVFLALLVVFIQTSLAGALNRPANGITARDLATAGGFTVADPNGASAVFLNPAALTAIDKWAWDLGLVGLTTNFSYDRDLILGGGHFAARDETFLFPYGAVAYRWQDLVFALGIDAPYGLAADYGDSLGFDTYLSFVDVTLGAAYEFNEYFSLGASFKTVYGDADLRMPLLDQTGTALLGLTTTEADGFGYGFQLGLLFRFDPFKLGLVYAPSVKVGIDGETKFPAGVGIASDNMSAGIYQPERFGVGLSWQALEELKAGVSYFRTDYGKNDQVAVRYDNLPVNVLDLGWSAVDAVHAGLEYEPDEVWTLRLGGAWMSAGTPDYSPPSIPDGAGWIVTGGVGCQIVKHTYLDLGAGYYFADRRISVSARNIGAGDIDLNGWMLGIGIRQEF